MNGNVRAFPGVPPDEIPCRVSGTCGVWVGTDGERDIRGPLRIVLADSEERADSAVQSGHRLRDQYGVPAIIVGCTEEVVESVFSQVTTTETVLIAPVTSADTISDLPDRTPSEQTAQAPGWVYRTVTPSYMQASMMALLGSNRISTAHILSRVEDETSQRCTMSSDCAALGPQFECRVPVRTSSPEREWANIRTDSCAGQEDGYCDRFGRNYECRTFDESVGPVCAQFRTLRYCSRYASPRTAMILYENSAFGEDMRDGVRSYWTSHDGLMLSEMSFDIGASEDHARDVEGLFQIANARFSELRASGQVDANAQFSDSVVFLLASSANDGAFLLQEWAARANQFGIDGVENVAWIATDFLRNELLVNQLDYHTIRNLFLVSPVAIDSTFGGFFRDLYRARWGTEPPNLTEQVFDAVLLLALANERAAGLAAAASNGVPLGPVDATSLKNQVPEVAGGCYRTSVADAFRSERCVDLLGASPRLASASTFDQAMLAARSAEHIRYVGASGDMTFSPAGDRSSLVVVWKVEPAAGGRGRFFELESHNPQNSAIQLRQ